MQKRLADWRNLYLEVSHEMKTPQQFWDKIAPRYARNPIRDEKSYQKKLAVTQEYFRPDWSVFEFGCGTGSTALIHAPHVKHIVATDVSRSMLDIAEEKARAAGVDNISFRQGTLESLELEAESFDAALGLNILHLLDDLEAAIARVGGLLKPGGVFVSSTVLIGELKFYWRMLIPVMQAVGFAPYVNRFDKRTLVSMLTHAGFDIEHEWQPGRASVFIVARKR
jgi:ubiquinone/menaquinone biosynthesis C-methylase UbiE